MKAVRFNRFGGPDVLEIVELSDPHPGPGEIRIAVRAAGVNPSDWRKRAGEMDPGLPQTLGYEAAGVVDEIGGDVRDVAIGDRVFGVSPYGAAQAELAILSEWATIPQTLDFAGAAVIPAVVETAARTLDRLGVTSGSTLLVYGASGSVGSAAVQLAAERGARVIGTGSPGTHAALRSLGAEPVAYGDGMSERVKAIAPSGVDLALDAAGGGALPRLVELAGAPERVVTVADPLGARKTGVYFSRGDAGRATYALAHAARMAAQGRFSIAVGGTFPLADVARAHSVGESGSLRGKIALVID
ncbi:NADP-dependent oxidoreductase [Tsukamurella sp. 8F]|uniref:NADP-dependent oxidoreductase n=1 Tax=unclassified Tsukamurella TaxID=2633480 RepID=UPI0023B94A47|nr:MULTISPECIES: NADP-dependent oxidoreductase [unclassified Tsukamurella]MDF0530202.1 NADP-dependent oxidoreductase [Tsukamurella sp. 8J]MDF0586519.1 NADP-dependent oxidoreductase [Tsukamurella sp. 8F]